ncbi:hypothetical protein ACOME3_001013 [Neoechinorhynchus agilis]
MLASGSISHLFLTNRQKLRFNSMPYNIRMGISLFTGYIFGRLIYSFKCREMFLKEAPDGLIAKKLKGIPINPYEIDQYEKEDVMGELTETDNSLPPPIVPKSMEEDYWRP